MKISAVIVAAGGSTRMRSGGASKLMMAVGGEPVLRRTLRAFDAAACISEIVVVAREVDFEDVRRAADGVCADAVRFGAAALAVPVKDTVKIASEEEFVQATPDRAALRAVQTPQVFERRLYLSALDRAAQAGKSYTDDCQLIEAAGGRVFLTAGDYKNIKITTPEDLLVAEAFAAAESGAAVRKEKGGQ